MKLMPLIALSTALLCQGCATPVSHQKQAANICTVDTNRVLINQFYAKAPGAPIPIATHDLEISEAHLISALPQDWRIGTPATPEVTRAIWESIDGWGKTANTKLIFGVNGIHNFIIPTHVPMTQIDEKDGYLDIKADNGDGMHGHIITDDVKYVYALRLPGKDNKIFTRSIGFYDPRGGLIVSIYVNLPSYKGEISAINGFESSWDLIANMPRVCTQ